ncbi:MAG: hypothetical protein IKA20_05720 [Clostridia bacterium]|nr:hypothetical protein [Clostridia bacterium]
MSNQNTARKPILPSRILAAIIAVACIVTFILPLQLISLENGTFVLKEGALFNALGSLFKSDLKVFGFLPSFAGASNIGLVATAALYYFMLSSIAAFIIAIVAIVLRDKSVCFARIATLIFTWGVAVYALSVVAISCYLTTTPATVDKWTTILALLGAVIYFVMMILKVGARAIINAAQFLLSVVVIGMLLFALTDEGNLVSDAVNANEAYKKVVIITLVVMTALLILGSLTAMTKNGAGVEFGRVIAQEFILLFILFVGYKSNLGSASFLRYCVEGAVVTLAQIVVASILLVRQVKEKASEVPAVAEELEQEEAEESETEETAEETEENVAATEEIAEEAAPIAQSNEPFDPFIATLSEEQKAAFIDLYVLKCKTPMPEIPTYEVGGNNKAFFNKVFIYLGQYRDKIPSDLLEKIYEHSMKI